MNDAAPGNGGIAAFNIITLEHAEAVPIGAGGAGQPVFLKVSGNPVKLGAIRRAGCPGRSPEP